VWWSIVAVVLAVFCLVWYRETQHGPRTVISSAKLYLDLARAGWAVAIACVRSFLQCGRIYIMADADVEVGIDHHGLRHLPLIRDERLLLPCPLLNLGCLVCFRDRWRGAHCEEERSLPGSWKVRWCQGPWNDMLLCCFGGMLYTVVCDIASLS
jgi:hypothetical protein